MERPCIKNQGREQEVIPYILLWASACTHIGMCTCIHHTQMYICHIHTTRVQKKEKKDE